MTLPNWTQGVYPEKLKPLSDFSFGMKAYTKEMQRLRGGELVITSTHWRNSHPIFFFLYHHDLCRTFGQGNGRSDVRRGQVIVDQEAVHVLCAWCDRCSFSIVSGYLWWHPAAIRLHGHGRAPWNSSQAVRCAGGVLKHSSLFVAKENNANFVGRFGTRMYRGTVWSLFS